MTRVRIGTAGWAIPRAVAEAFPAEGAGLQRYADRFDATEINSTFYRSHRPSTFERWVETTPADFRFALKLPRSITHDARLIDAGDLLARFRDEVAVLAEKGGPLLVQLPPSLAFEAVVAERFFADLRAVWPDFIACEPRHPTWFDAEVSELLAAVRVARVAADPARHPDAGRPAGWPNLAYWRLHGSPRMYASPYDEAALRALAADLLASPADEIWCVFDNTTSGAAAANALRLKELVAQAARPEA